MNKRELQAWIVVDYQEDFANPNVWTLYVKDWENIFPFINEVCMEIKKRAWFVLTSRELHTQRHPAFASSFIWKEAITESFKRWEAPSGRHFITLEELNEWKIILPWDVGFWEEELRKYFEIEWDNQPVWPDHCIKGTFWAKYREWFDTSLIDMEVKKWFEMTSHPYSAFWWFDMEWKVSTFEMLKNMWVKVLNVMWLATDYCIKATALDWVRYWFQVNLIKKATAWVDPAWVIEALKEMRENWVKIID